MKPMHSVTISTPHGEKTISVYSCDIQDFDETIDIFTVSAFVGSYIPTPGTVVAALDSAGIDVEMLSYDPEVDLRTLCNMWISEKIEGSHLQIGRIACVEMRHSINPREEGFQQEENILGLVKAYFKMLDLAATSGMKAETIAMPLIGAGCQGISAEVTAVPIINECINFLKSSEHVKRFYFVDYDASNAFKIANALTKSYSLFSQSAPVLPMSQERASADHVFISYSFADKSIADSLCAVLESRGMRVWYAPRNIYGSDYASAIVKAIMECSHFVVIISRNSLGSEDVLNEIDLAFNELRRRKIKCLPLKMDDEELRPAFLYYLSRQHWMDAQVPPVEKRFEEFADKMITESANGNQER